MTRDAGSLLETRMSWVCGMPWSRILWDFWDYVGLCTLKYTKSSKPQMIGSWDENHRFPLPQNHLPDVLRLIRIGLRTEGERDHLRHGALARGVENHLLKKKALNRYSWEQHRKS